MRFLDLHLYKTTTFFIRMMLHHIIIIAWEIFGQQEAWELDWLRSPCWVASSFTWFNPFSHFTVGTFKRKGIHYFSRLYWRSKEQNQTGVQAYPDVSFEKACDFVKLRLNVLENHSDRHSENFIYQLSIDAFRFPSVCRLSWINWV